MKLIYIANSRIPTEKAHGYQISKTCEALGAAGIETELWIPKRKSWIKDDLFEYYGLQKTFAVKTIRCFDFYRFYKYLGNYSFWLHSILFFWKLALTSPSKDAVIYTRNPEIVWLFSIKGHKTVFEFHRWAESKQALLKFFIKKASGFVAVTTFLKNKAVAYGIKPTSVLVAADAVDLTIFDKDMSRAEARERLKLPQDKIILGYTGAFRTMGEEKGIGYVLKALNILNENKIIFVAVGGEKNDIEYYRELAIKLGVEDKVFLLEKTDRGSLAVCQKACDLLLMPFPKTTHYSYYMSPLKMFEYMASGRPIVASDLPSVREVLDENQAVLVEPENADDLARGISGVLADSDCAQKLSAKAHEAVLNYTWEKRAQKIKKFIGSASSS